MLDLIECQALICQSSLKKKQIISRSGQEKILNDLKRTKQTDSRAVLKFPLLPRIIETSPHKASVIRKLPSQSTAVSITFYVGTYSHIL